MSASSVHGYKHIFEFCVEEKQTLRKSIMYRAKIKRSAVNKNISECAARKENASLKCLKSKLYCNSKRKSEDSSAVWQYYGELYSSDATLLDDGNYYCEPCLTREKSNLKAG